MNLTTQQRRSFILDQLFSAGNVEVKKLALEMSVSEATVRRDLRSLADERQLELVYGGATLGRSHDYSFNTRSMRNIEAKRTIARLASTMIEDNETVFIDAGTTCLELCPYLKRKRNLTVIINSLRLAEELGQAEGINLIVIGGQYRAERLDTVGPLAISMLDQLRGYYAFIGSDGLSLDFGVAAAEIDSAYLHRTAIKNAREVILLADHTKFNIPSLYKIAEFESIGRIVTDTEPSAEWMEYMSSHGIEVMFPSEKNGAGEVVAPRSADRSTESNPPPGLS